jgi:four helix bundle protein
VTYDQWEQQVPRQLRKDPIWKMEAYRLGLFLSDLARLDAAQVLKHRIVRNNSDQLYRAASNISSNVTEGYSRSTPADRGRFYEYALGSVRETRDWYYKVRECFNEKVTDHRLTLSNQLISLLVAMIVNERRRQTRIRKGTAE